MIPILTSLLLVKTGEGEMLLARILKLACPQISSLQQSFRFQLFHAGLFFRRQRGRVCRSDPDDIMVVSQIPRSGRDAKVEARRQIHIRDEKTRLPFVLPLNIELHFQGLKIAHPLVLSHFADG